MEIIRAGVADISGAAPLIAQFRVELRAYRGIASAEHVDAAGEEFLEYIAAGYPVYLCRIDGEWAGYLVCRVSAPNVWVEALYVLPRHRRKGLGAALFAVAEQLAQDYGEDTLYIYIHPNNTGMIEFLRRQGYTVLNLIEIRKKHKGESTRCEITVGGHTFDY